MELKMNNYFNDIMVHHIMGFLCLSFDFNHVWKGIHIIWLVVSSNSVCQVFEGIPNRNVPVPSLKDQPLPKLSCNFIRYFEYIFYNLKLSSITLVLSGTFKMK